jgi:glycosyltransferase involved in cell wall biosynthesis
VTASDLRDADPAAAAPPRDNSGDGRRKVLLISYTFPPQYDVSARRATKLCKYLPAAGWQPVVLTKDWRRDIAPEDRRAYVITSHPAAFDEISGVEVIRAPYRTHDNVLRRIHERLGGVYQGTAATATTETRARWTPSALARRALSLLSPVFGDFPDAFRGWVPPAVRAGVEIVRRERIDVICSVCPPASAHVVASEIARRTRVPWVAQFDDLYSFHLERQARAEWRPYTDWRHRGWMREAAFAGAITPAMLAYVRRTYGLDGDVVMVGFDPDDRPVASPAHGPRMRLAYTGSVYPGDQRPDLLFETLESLHADGASPPIEVVFAGTGRDTELRMMLEAFPNAARVCTFIERLAPADALRLQREADALILLNCTSPSPDEGTLSFPSKAFEYLNAGRPIVALPRDPGAWGDTLLETTRAGVTADSPSGAAAVLAGWLATWREQGALPYQGNASEIERYSVSRQAETLASLLERAVSRTAR